MIFDQYQRYKTVQIIAETIKQQYQIHCLNILEIGANEQCNLEKVLPDENIIYSDIELPETLKNDSRFIVVDGRNMPQFEDGKYDIVVALDVLEHIEREDRESFLKEVNRVSKYVSIICFPYNNTQICSVEKRINNYYRALYGQDHIWLKEHIDNGLPYLEHIQAWLAKKNYKYVMFKHGNIVIWEEMMKALFTSYQNNNFISFMESINEIYEQKIYKHDIGMSNYRVFLVLSKEDKLINHLNKLIHTTFDSVLDKEEEKLLFRNISDLKRMSVASTEENNDKDEVYGKIYLNRKHGFLEDDVLYVKAVNIGIDKYRCDCCISDIENVVALRYDPIEGKRCIITKCEIKQDDKILSVDYSACYHGNIGVLLFDTDPMLITQIKDNINDISMNIEFLVEGKAFINEVFDDFRIIQKDYLETSIKTEETQNQLSEIRKQLLETKDRLVESKVQLSESGDILEKTKLQLEDVKKQLCDANDNNSKLQHKLECSEKRRQDEFDYSKIEKEMLFSDLHSITDMKDRHIGLLGEQLLKNKKELDEKDMKIDLITKELQRQVQDSETKEKQTMEEFQKIKESTEATIRDRDMYKERIEKMERTLSWRLTKCLRFVGNRLGID